MQDTLQQRLDFFGLGGPVAERLAPVADSAGRHLDDALQRFAAQAATTPSAARFLYGRERIEGDAGGPTAHWQALLSGRLDKGFAEAATRMGQRHARIGVEPRWQAGSHAIIAQALVAGIVRDGIAAMTRPRRGPLGLLAAPDPAALNDATDVLASGVAALVGAVIFDLDLAMSGYVDRLRHDAEAKAEASNVRLRDAVAGAATMLELAAEGRVDSAAMEPLVGDLAPLQRGAEHLADRVGALMQDLQVAGEAARILSSRVLAEGRQLVGERLAQQQHVQPLLSSLAAQLPAAAALAGDLAPQVRQVKALLRRCQKARRALDASQHRQEAAAAPGVDLIERVDGLGHAANMMVARLATRPAESEAGQGLEADLQGLALGLAQVAAQLRAGMRLADRASEDVEGALSEAMLALDRIGADLAAEVDVLAALEKQSRDLAAGLDVARDHAAALGAILDPTEGTADGALQRLQLALDDSATLLGLAQTMQVMPDEPAMADPILPSPDHDALAAHWHVV